MVSLLMDIFFPAAKGVAKVRNRRQALALQRDPLPWPAATPKLGFNLLNAAKDLRQHELMAPAAGPQGHRP